METVPASEQPGWQDITFELIESKIKSKDFKDALFFCKLRKEALESVLQDIEQAIASSEQQTHENGPEINSKDWEKEQQFIQEEIIKLTKYMMEINSQSKIE